MSALVAIIFVLVGILLKETTGQRAVPPASLPAAERVPPPGAVMVVPVVAKPAGSKTATPTTIPTMEAPAGATSEGSPAATATPVPREGSSPTPTLTTVPSTAASTPVVETSAAPNANRAEMAKGFLLEKATRAPEGVSFLASAGGETPQYSIQYYEGSIGQLEGFVLHVFPYGLLTQFGPEEAEKNRGEAERVLLNLLGPYTDVVCELKVSVMYMMSSTEPQRLSYCAAAK